MTINKYTMLKNFIDVSGTDRRTGETVSIGLGPEGAVGPAIGPGVYEVLQNFKNEFGTVYTRGDRFENPFSDADVDAGNVSLEVIGEEPAPEPEEPQP